MIKKFWLFIILGLVVLAIIGGRVYLWQRNKPASTSQSTLNSNIDKPKEEPKYPKIETYDVPILMYHYIRIADAGDELGINLSVTPKNFDDQLLWLKDNNYETVKVSDLADTDKKAISKIIFDKKKPIVLTFDDGYEDVYTAALPIMKKYEFVGTFYIIRNSVGKPEYMNQSQIDKMTEAGMEIGSHSLSHPNLASLDTQSQHEQIFDSKFDAIVFCYPAGKYNDTTVSLLKEAGYTTAVTTKSGIANQDSNLFELPRVRMQDFSGVALGKKLE